MEFPYHGTDIPGELTNRHKMQIKHKMEVMPAENAKLVEVLTDNNTIELMIINEGKSELSLHCGIV